MMRNKYIINKGIVIKYSTNLLMDNIIKNSFKMNFKLNGKLHLKSKIIILLN